MSGCGPVVALVGGAPAGASVSVESIDNVIYEVNFANLATNTFADGAEVIDGLTWTVAGTAQAGATWELTNGQGIRWTAGAVSVFNANDATNTAPRLSLPFSSIPNYDSRYLMIFEFYFSVITLAAGTANRIQVANWGLTGSPTGIGNRMRSTGFTSVAGTRTSFHVIDTGAVTTGAATGATDNVVALKVDTVGLGGGLFGTWGTTWPPVDQYIILPTAGSTINAFYNSQNRIGIGFPASGAGNNSGTLERMRVIRLMA